MKKVPKYIYIIFIFILIIFINIVDNNSYKKNNEVSKYTYISNNEYNSDFEYDDIEKSENAIYSKYITKEAQKKIINQKIYVKIKKIKVDDKKDESTATKSKYTTTAIDQNNNIWKLSSDTDYFSDEENIKVYGIYKGVFKKKSPIIEVYEYRTDMDYINEKKFKNISEQYIEKLNDSYKKEKFLFNSYEESIDGLDLEYINSDKTIGLSIFVSKSKMKIRSIAINVHDYKISFSDIDKKLWYSIITTFNQNLTEEDADNLIIGGLAAEQYSSNTSEINEYKYKGCTITIFNGTKGSPIVYLGQD